MIPEQKYQLHHQQKNNNCHFYCYESMHSYYIFFFYFLFFILQNISQHGSSRKKKKLLIFPQTKTAQIHFPPKDSRRFRHGRASATEGVLKVLLQPAVQVHIWGGRASTGTRFGYTARRQKRRHGPFPAPFSVSSILLFHLYAYPIDLTFCYSQASSSFKIEHGGHTEKTLVERLLSRKLIRVHFGLALLSHKHVDTPRRNHYFFSLSQYLEDNNLLFLW